MSDNELAHELGPVLAKELARQLGPVLAKELARQLVDELDPELAHRFVGQELEGGLEECSTGEVTANKGNQKHKIIIKKYSINAPSPQKKRAYVQQVGKHVVGQRNKGRFRWHLGWGRTWLLSGGNGWLYGAVRTFLFLLP